MAMEATAARQELPALTHGDHCCLFFRSTEQHADMTSRFLAIGLERDERCVYVGDEASIESVRQGMRDAGVVVERESAKGRLILTSDREYLDGDRWSTEKMLGFLQKAYDGAISDRFTALRAAGDVSWQVGPEGEYGDVVFYEALLDMFFIGKRMIGMCQYHQDKCPPETLTGILETHRLAAVGSDVCSNFHYVPPGLLIEKNPRIRQEKRADWMTSQLLRVKRAEAERDEIQKQFLHSQKLEAVGRLAGGVAHDFNNILTGILGLSEFVLANPAADESIKSDVREIHRSGERAAGLTRQLLAFSRKQILQPRIMSLNDSVQSMEKLLRRVIRESIELKTVLSPELGGVKADPGQIEQIIMNLAVNARDAMPQGGALTLETGNVELGEDYAEAHPGVKAGPCVMLAVGDTGVGMSREVQERVFEPFFTTKEIGKGTGLGLSTVHDIVRQIGGSISFHSEPQKGTTFKVYFPRADEEAPPEDVRGAKPAGDLRGSETILVVDDDDLVRKLVHRVLVDHGYTVLDAISSPEALKFCERHQGNIHLMITDVVLPQMNGRDLARQAIVLRPRMKVLFMSGYTGDALAHHGGDGGVFLEKPFLPDAILRKAREVLG